MRLGTLEAPAERIIGETCNRGDDYSTKELIWSFSIICCPPQNEHHRTAGKTMHRIAFNRIRHLTRYLFVPLLRICIGFPNCRISSPRSVASNRQRDKGQGMQPCPSVISQRHVWCCSWHWFQAIKTIEFRGQGGFDTLDAWSCSRGAFGMVPWYLNCTPLRTQMRKVGKANTLESSEKVRAG